MSTALFVDDIVERIADRRQLAVVERTHEDVDSHAPNPGHTEHDSIKRHPDVDRSAFERFKVVGIPPKGTVLVRWTHVIDSELIPETALNLLDRSLIIGDIVKRNVQDPMSGVVINAHTKCTLQPIGDVTYRNSETSVKGLMSLMNPVDDLRSNNVPSCLVDIPASELMYAESPSEEDVIIYKEWIGRIQSMAYNITLKLMDNGVVEIGDHLASHADDAVDVFFVGDIARTKKGNLRTGNWIFGKYNPNTPPVGTVVSIRAIQAQVAWLHKRDGSTSMMEPPEILERDELESEDLHIYDRSKRPTFENRERSSKTISNPEIDVRLGLRVRFRDLGAACAKYDGSTSHGKLSRLDRQETLGYDLNVFDVMSLYTEVMVQWQDLSVTHENSISLIPDTDVEDLNAVWPTEVAHTADVVPAPELTSIWQAKQVGIVQSVRAGERMAKIRWCPDGVMHFSRDPDDDLAPQTLVAAHIGQASGDEQEVSLYDIEASGEVNVRRGDMALVVRNTNIGTQDPQSIEWLGQILDTRLDGTLLLRLGVATPVRDVIVRREQVIVAVRTDTGGPQVVDDFPEELEEVDSDEWSESDGMETDDVNEILATWEDEDGQPLDPEDAQGDEWESEDEEGDIPMTDEPEPDSSQRTPPPSTPTSANPGNETTYSPEQYLILSTDVPSSHHYSHQPPTTVSAHMKRTQKEHKILQKPGALPEGVYIRTWESRLDLIRALLIGPEGTPYAHAPFVMDFWLPPQFPTEPPQVFFHSWPAVDGSGGRVNPNLYEDGKICLSVLGTWEGSKGEGWSPARSTLLQVIVSLLGLVLVPEPYFNEAGFEHLAGLETSKRPSALYSERTVIRATGFAVTALNRLRNAQAENKTEAMGLDGITDVLSWLYNTPQGPRLVDRLIDGVDKALQNSEQNPSAEPDGKTIMSQGARVPLRRLLQKLQALK